MLQRDFIMRQIQQGIQAIIDAIHHRRADDPDLACESIKAMLGSVSEMDPAVLLALSPESIGTILDLGGAMSDSTAEVVVRGLVLESDILRTEKNDPALAQLRFEQARGIALTFHLEFDEICDVVDEAGARQILEDARAEAEGVRYEAGQGAGA